MTHHEHPATHRPTHPAAHPPTQPAAHSPAVSGPPPQAVAAWVEHRLHDALGCCPAPARLYGLEVLDAAGFVDPAMLAGRLTFVAEADDATALVLGTEAAEAVRRFDAIVLAATRWAPAELPMSRPASFAATGAGRGHPVRRRARVVTAVGDDGTASALRFDHEPERVVIARGLSTGGIAGVQLAAMWSARSA